jgi:hypothetical protein
MSYEVSATTSDAIAAKEVAVFGCESLHSAAEYSGTTFVGLDSPSMETSMLYGGKAAAAFVGAGGGQAGVDAANNVLSASPRDVDKGAKVVLVPPKKEQSGQ